MEEAGSSGRRASLAYGNRSALDWVIDQYQVSTTKAAACRGAVQ